MPGLTARVWRLYFRKAERLTLNLFGRDMHRVGPTSSGTRGTSKLERSYGLRRGTTAGFSSALLQPMLSNFSAHELVKCMTGAHAGSALPEPRRSRVHDAGVSHPPR